MVTERVTQVPVEVAEQLADADISKRVTQVPVEVAEQVPYGAGSMTARFTQIVIEVAITFPVHPWADQPFPEHPPWSPSYIQDPIESKEQAYQSFYGIHNKEIHIGERRIWSKFLRR